MLQILGLRKDSTLSAVTFWKYMQMALALLIIVLHGAAPFCPVVAQLLATGVANELTQWLEGFIVYLTVATTDKLGAAPKNT